MKETVSALSLKKSKGERISRFAPYGYKFDGDNIVIVDIGTGSNSNSERDDCSGSYNPVYH